MVIRLFYYSLFLFKDDYGLHRITLAGLLFPDVDYRAQKMRIIQLKYAPFFSPSALSIWVAFLTQTSMPFPYPP